MLLELLRSVTRPRRRHRESIATATLAPRCIQVAPPRMLSHGDGQIIIGRTTRAEVHRVLGPPRTTQGGDSSTDGYEQWDFAVFGAGAHIDAYYYLSVSYHEDRVRMVYGSGPESSAATRAPCAEANVLRVSWHEVETQEAEKAADDENDDDQDDEDDDDQDDDECACIHRERLGQLPSDAVVGALLRGEITRRQLVEQLLGEPTYARCERCRGHDVEYLFESEGAQVPMALVFTYAESGDVLSVSAHSTPGAHHPPNTGTPTSNDGPRDDTPEGRAYWEEFARDSRQHTRRLRDERVRATVLACTEHRRRT